MRTIFWVGVVVKFEKQITRIVIREQPNLYLLKPPHRSIFGLPEQKHTVLSAYMSTAS